MNRGRYPKEHEVRLEAREDVVALLDEDLDEIHRVEAILTSGKAPARADLLTIEDLTSDAKALEIGLIHSEHLHDHVLLEAVAESEEAIERVASRLASRARHSRVLVRVLG